MATKKIVAPEEQLKSDYQGELFSLLENLKSSILALEEAKASYEERLTQVELRDKELALYSGQLKDRDSKLKESEAGFAKREAEVNEKVKRIKTVEEAREMMVKADIKEGQARQLIQEATLKFNEAVEMQKEITVRELALGKERGEYKQRVREEIVNNFLKK